MRRTFFAKVTESLRYATEWFSETPERALDRAYNAALQIKAIEDEYFGGNKITFNSNTEYGDSVMSYFRGELAKNLNIAKSRLVEFRASRSFLSISERQPTKEKGVNGSLNGDINYQLDSAERANIILEKLKFIDFVIAKYAYEQRTAQTDNSLSLVVVSKKSDFDLDAEEISSLDPDDPLFIPTNSAGIRTDDSVSDKTGILPRSIFKTINRLQKELDPQSEEEVVKKFRKSKAKTTISIRFILILIIVPLLTYQLSKLFVIGPLVDRYRSENEVEIFINRDLEEEALTELQTYKERLDFENLIFEDSKLSPQQIKHKIKERAEEIAQESREQSANAIKNVLSDFLGLVSFAFVLFSSRREIAILKSFMDEVVYGLSDSAKAFIIILFTDIFVGYHSPHGWEVLLAGVSRHLGLPENQEFIFLFIATFPVILDTVFKYWIFRYLNRISPSAVATYRNMNE